MRYVCCLPDAPGFGNAPCTRCLLSSRTQDDGGRTASTSLALSLWLRPDRAEQQAQQAPTAANASARTTLFATPQTLSSHRPWELPMPPPQLPPPLPCSPAISQAIVVWTPTEEVVARAAARAAFLASGCPESSRAGELRASSRCTQVGVLERAGSHQAAAAAAPAGNMAAETVPVVDMMVDIMEAEFEPGGPDTPDTSAAEISSIPGGEPHEQGTTTTSSMAVG